MIPILTYHRIGRPSAAARRRGMFTTEDAFARHLSFLSARGFTFCDFQDLALAEDGEHPLPDRPVLITFDDGHADNFTHALPILRAHSAKASVFVVAGDVGKRNVVWSQSGETLPTDLLTWEQAAEMQRSGIRIESHGLHHRRMPLIEPTQLAQDLATSRAMIREQLGYEPIALAYPYGAHDERAAACAHDAGFRYAVTTVDGVADIGSDDARALPRIAVKGYRWPHGWTFRRRIGRLALGSKG